MSILNLLFAVLITLSPLIVLILIANKAINSGFYKKSKKGTQSNEGSLNQQWDAYIRSFYDVVRTETEKNLLAAMLARKVAGQLYDKVDTKNGESSTAETSSTTSNDVSGTDDVLPSQPSVLSAQIEPKSISEPVDGTTLLLYFGAFLLVAAAGLFVAIGTFSGAVRTAILAITVASLYAGGLWLYQNKQKLTKAGISFMGTAMIIAPLVGVAFYNLVAHQTNGAAIWLTTSLACMGFYIHALRVVRSSFVPYLLIGSFVSTIEASVLVMSLPSYVFAWGLVLAAMIVVLANIKKKGSVELVEAGDISARVLTPLSIFSSIIMLDKFGSWQLGVTLLMTTFYYGFLAWQSSKHRSIHVLVAQLTSLAAILSFSYSLTRSWTVCGLVFAAVGIIYACAITYLDKQLDQSYYLSQVAAAIVALSIAFTIGDASALWLTMLLGTVSLAAIWLKWDSQPSLISAGLLLAILPIVVGQYTLSPHLDMELQLAASAIAAFILLLVVVMTKRIKELEVSYETASSLFIVSIMPLIVLSWLLGFVWLIGLSVALIIVFIALAIVTSRQKWLLSAGLVGFLPVLLALGNSRLHDVHFSIAVFIVLVVNILISLASRQAAQRWLLVAAIMLTPVAIAGGGLGFKFGSTGYSMLYLVAMAGCILGRAIARGKLLFSSHKPISGYDKISSIAYVAGYILSASVAVVVSTTDANSRVLTTVVLGFISVAVFVLAYVIENMPRILLALPILLQLMIISGTRPSMSDSSIYITFYGIASVVIAGLVYLVIEQNQKSLQSIYRGLTSLTVATAYVGPLVVASYWSGLPNLGASGATLSLLPISLTLAGILTIYHNRGQKQAFIEMSTGGIIASYHWILYLLGVHNIHIHAHLLALVLAGFAYWRWRLGDKEVSGQYVVALFLVPTAPLVLQALGGESGGIYGLLLIIQQIFFMVAGIFTSQRFLTRAGLWVAIAAVLYQLRGLGWAFVALLALVLIGVAVYRLQYHPDQNNG